MQARQKERKRFVEAGRLAEVAPEAAEHVKQAEQAVAQQRMSLRELCSSNET